MITSHTLVLVSSKDLKTVKRIKTYSLKDWLIVYRTFFKNTV